MNVTVSLGGSVFTEELGNVRRFAEQVKELSEDGKVVVVVGAGSLKKFIKASSDDAGFAEKDMVGIRATRLNASVLNSFFEKSFSGIPKSLEELREAVSKYDIVVMGGTEPGHSTDAVAALAGEIIDADLMVNLTDVDGVYREGDKMSEKFSELGYNKLRKVLETSSTEPGKYSLIDRTAVDILDRSGISMVVVDGKEEECLLKAVSGEYEGTVVK